MFYQEYKPKSFLSRHVECFWTLQAEPLELRQKAELWPPDCTFEILFSDHPFQLNFLNESPAISISPVASFLGQKTSPVSFESDSAINLFGIRFKPFALAGRLKTPMFTFNDKSVLLSSIFGEQLGVLKLSREIKNEKSLEKKIELAESLVIEIFKEEFKVDERCRTRTNYILDHKGMVKVNDLLENFGTTKITLRKQFLQTTGLSPKAMSRVWRLNYFLQLKNESPSSLLTELCLQAGFFDQAHFIKEFKCFFMESPLKFFRHESNLLSISQGIITRRFTHHYDPYE